MLVIHEECDAKRRGTCLYCSQPINVGEPIVILRSDEEEDLRRTRRAHKNCHDSWKIKESA
jgi:hypothetical protein